MLEQFYLLAQCNSLALLLPEENATAMHSEVDVGQGQGDQPSLKDLCHSLNAGYGSMAIVPCGPRGKAADENTSSTRSPMTPASLFDPSSELDVPAPPAPFAQEVERSGSDGSDFGLYKTVCAIRKCRMSIVRQPNRWDHGGERNSLADSLMC